MRFARQNKRHALLFRPLRPSSGVNSARNRSYILAFASDDKVPVFNDLNVLNGLLSRRYALRVSAVKSLMDYFISGKRNHARNARNSSMAWLNSAGFSTIGK